MRWLGRWLRPASLDHAWSDDRFDLSRGGQTDTVDGLFVSGTFFSVLGVEPALGRLLSPDDDRRGGGAEGPTAVISHRVLAHPVRRRPVGDR